MISEVDGGDHNGKQYGRKKNNFLNNKGSDNLVTVSKLFHCNKCSGKKSPPSGMKVQQHVGAQLLCSDRCGTTV